MADWVIRGMEMPTKCADCYLVVLGWCCCLQKYVAYDSKPLNCPLVPLPEGHGRLIDADRLAKRLKDFVDWCRDDRRKGAFFVMDCPLPDIPTIVPAEGGNIDGN